MPKLARAKPVKKLFDSEVDLRRWCIENAIRWPTENYGAAVYSQGGGVRHDVDVIARAEKILKWVKTAA